MPHRRVSFESHVQVRSIGVDGGVVLYVGALTHDDGTEVGTQHRSEENGRSFVYLNVAHHGRRGIGHIGPFPSNVRNIGAVIARTLA